MNSKKLAHAVRELKNEAKDALEDEVIDSRSSGIGTINEALDLLYVLANIVDGMAIEKAFGSPGDWGYGSPIGDALVNRE